VDVRMVGSSVVHTPVDDSLVEGGTVHYSLAVRSWFRKAYWVDEDHPADRS
jgi:hypothetical protein